MSDNEFPPRPTLVNASEGAGDTGDGGWEVSVRIRHVPESTDNPVIFLEEWRESHQDPRNTLLHVMGANRVRTAYTLYDLVTAYVEDKLRQACHDLGLTNDGWDQFRDSMTSAAFADPARVLHYFGLTLLAE